jgi:hypothetical protein
MISDNPYNQLLVTGYHKQFFTCMVLVKSCEKNHLPRSLILNLSSNLYTNEVDILVFMFAMNDPLRPFSHKTRLLQIVNVFDIDLTSV